MSTFSSKIKHELHCPKYGLLEIPFEGVEGLDPLIYFEEDFTLEVLYTAQDGNKNPTIRAYYRCPVVEFLKECGIFSQEDFSADSCQWQLSDYEVVVNEVNLAALGLALFAKYNELLKRLEAGELEGFNAEKVLDDFVAEKFSAPDSENALCFYKGIGGHWLNIFKEKLSDLECAEDVYRYWDTPECPDCGERAEEPFTIRGEAWRYVCSNGHSVLYLIDDEDDNVNPYEPSRFSCTPSDTEVVTVELDEVQAFCDKNKLLEVHPDPNSGLKRGDVISFIAGYNYNIPMFFKIIGFEVSKERGAAIYVDWDCYWSPIYEEERRQITLVSNVHEAIAARAKALNYIND